MADTTSFRNKHLPHTLTLDHVAPATRLLEKRRQMFEVQEALDAQKEEFARREEAFRRREEGLRKKDLELQESLIKFNKFLQENEFKRQRALRRAEEEEAQWRKKDEEIQRLRKQLDEMQALSQALQQTLDRNRKYEQYLTAVQEPNAEDYPEINDLLMRYKTLREAYEDLKRRQEEYAALNDQKRQEFNAYTAEQSTDILNFNTEIANLKKRLELHEQTNIKLQHKVDKHITTASGKTLELGQILMAVENLLARCSSKRHGAGKAQAHEGRLSAEAVRGFSDASEMASKAKLALKHLDRIRAYMQDFQDIEVSCPKESRRSVMAPAALTAASAAAMAASHAAGAAAHSPARHGGGGGHGGGDSGLPRGSGVTSSSAANGTSTSGWSVGGGGSGGGSGARLRSSSVSPLPP